MALFTKLFKKSHDPYELKGRWYKIRIEQPAADEQYTIVSSDIDISRLTLRPGSTANDVTYLNMKIDNEILVDCYMLMDKNPDPPTSGTWSFSARPTMGIGFRNTGFLGDYTAQFSLPRPNGVRSFDLLIYMYK